VWEHPIWDEASRAAELEELSKQGQLMTRQA
jgi:hypothetical protein